ncbi:hypothetical protein BDY19DRAFT_764258 [Irpex rosettiformis]|uniref:Uncharacterized protein n=1 Tax=Irpex rosettiformis TaxID=378272 RepID=A0ACB8U813_9APHY|nr:hypothetical protein BDY19DRAFT_764258 [Irpex rosettiformis]
MSQFYPHTQYAEDQPYSRAILTQHVLLRAFELGGGAGLGFGTLAHFASRFAARKVPSPPSLQAAASSVAGEPLAEFPFNRPTSLKLIHSAGYGSFLGVLALSFALIFRMRGKEDIEWKDRSWRLLENKGQVQLDNWTLVGALAGLGTVVSPPVARRYGGIAGLGWRGVVGGAALGSLAGLLGFSVTQAGSKSNKSQ